MKTGEARTEIMKRLFYQAMFNGDGKKYDDATERAKEVAVLAMDAGLVGEVEYPPVEIYAEFGSPEHSVRFTFEQESGS